MRLISIGKRTSFLIPFAVVLSSLVSQPREFRLVEQRRITSVDFERPSWVHESKQGILAVGLPTARQVVFFDQDGSRLGTVGASGGAEPGPFRSLTSAGWIGDSLWVFDYTAQRVTIVGPRFSIVRVLANSDLPGADSGVVPGVLHPNDMPWITKPVPLAFLENEKRLVRATVPPSKAPVGFDTSGTALFRVRGNGMIEKFVAHWHPSQFAAQLPGVQFQVRASEMLMPSAQRVSSNGNRIASLTRTNGEPPAMRLVMLAISGDTLFDRSIPYSPDSIPRTVAEGFMKQLILSAAGRGDTVAVAAALRRQLPTPTTYSPFSDILLGNDGVAWIVARPEASGRSRFLIFDDLGTQVGYASLPRVSVPITVARDHVWALETLPGSRTHVVRYEVRSQ